MFGDDDDEDEDEDEDEDDDEAPRKPRGKSVLTVRGAVYTTSYIPC